MTEKPVMMILPRWDPDEPRFIVKECEECSDDRAFKNNKCVFNRRLGFAYSVDEIVEVLNNNDVEDDFNQSECITVYDLKQEIKKLKKEIRELKQIPSKLDIRIEKLQDDLNKLSEMNTKDLNPQAVEDVTTVISISLNALLEFRKELEE